MVFTELDPEIARKAIEGYVDELTPQQTALAAFYRQFVCKRCGSKCRKEQVKGHVFADSDSLVPRSCLRCLACDALFDPFSGLLLEIGHR
jgi:hypothetical protein